MPTSRTSLVRHLAIIAVGVCAAGVSAGQASEVAFTLKAPQTVTINQMPVSQENAKTNVAVELAIQNGSGKAITLTRSGACNVHLWTVSDASGNIVDDRTICPALFDPQSKSISAGETFSERYDLKLASRKYGRGRYTLHFTFWGLESSAAFDVKIVQ